MRDARLTKNARENRKKMSEPAIRLWLELRAARFNGVKFRREKVIGDYIADFAANKPPIVIELDGDSHAFQQGYDEIRSAYLESRGYQVMRFTNFDVMQDMDGVLMELSRVIEALRHSPLPTLSPEGERA
jgi:very-short-patch-repair endonuclease